LTTCAPPAGIGPGETLVVVRVAEGIIEANCWIPRRGSSVRAGWSAWSPASPAAVPDRTLQQIAGPLEAMRERTPRGERGGIETEVGDN
jgi:hypothetical protein